MKYYFFFLELPGLDDITNKSDIKIEEKISKLEAVIQEIIKRFYLHSKHYTKI